MTEISSYYSLFVFWRDCIKFIYFNKSKKFIDKYIFISYILDDLSAGKPGDAYGPVSGHADTPNFHQSYEPVTTQNRRKIIIKKMFKRICVMALVLVLGLALPAPAFAEGYSTYDNKNLYLTVNGSGGENDNVILRTVTNGENQKWTRKWINPKEAAEGFYLLTDLNDTRALNINKSTNNCNIHTLKGNEFDAAILSHEGYHTLELKNYKGMYLGYTSLSVNANVLWKAAAGHWIPLAM